MLTFDCPGCRRKLRAPIHLAGKSITCPRCQARAAIPHSPSDEATLAPSSEIGPSPAPSTPGRADASAPLVPGYEILGELGRGGMGVVYKARQVKLNRLVALKMILAGGHAGDAEMGRFRREAEAVARLQHPGIVQVFEVGEAGGLPFFSLEFCPGGSLDGRLAGTPLSPREAAGLVAKLAEAMQSAHDQGIVHRDLKPANVLLQKSGSTEHTEHTEKETRSEKEELQAWKSADKQDRPGGSRQVIDLQPKITDFGLAKKLDDQGQTRTGAIMGTPSYMAPEQAEGKKEVGPSADVYALGAILYECLTGRPPFRAATPLDTILQVLTEEPVPPSRLNRRVPGDLETIALHCLQKDPARRYRNASALAADLHAFLEDRPIAARPVGRLVHAWRWCRRNRAVAALLFLFVVALTTGTVVSTVLGFQARQNAREARVNASEAAKNATLASERERLARETLYATGIDLTHREWQDSNVYRARHLLDTSEESMRGWEWHLLDHLLRGERLSLHGHQGFLLGMDVSPTRDRIATVGSDRTTRLWDARTGIELRTLTPSALHVRFSPDGRRLAGILRDRLQVWDADTGRLASASIPVEEPPAGLSFVDQGRQLAVVTQRGEITFLDPTSGEERSRCRKAITLDRETKHLANRGQFPVFGPDGRYLAQGGSEARVRVWDTTTGEQVLDGLGHIQHTCPPAFSPDGKRLASGGAEGIVRIWDLQSKKCVLQLRGHRAQVHGVAFSPDGRSLASASKDTTARVWDLESGAELLVLTGHVSEVWGIAFSPDGKHVLTRGAEGRVKVWDAGERVFHSSSLVSYFRERNLPDFGRAGSREAWTYHGHIGQAIGLALSSDGRFAATGALVEEGRPSMVPLWDLDRRQEVRSFPVPANSRAFPALAPDGKRLAIAITRYEGKFPSEVRVLDAATGLQVGQWTGPTNERASPVFSPDGKHLACAYSGQSGNSTLEVREIATGKPLFQQTRGTGMLGPFYLSADRFVTGMADGMVRIQNALTGEVQHSWRASQARLTALALGPNGEIATAEMGGAAANIRLWNAATQQERLVLEGHVGLVTGMAFAPDGARLVSCASDFTIKMWQTQTGRELLTFREHRDVPTHIAWSRDGRRFASVGLDGALKVFDVKLGGGVPDTSTWEPLYQDDFAREAPGDRWKSVHGASWLVRDGALRGSLTSRTNQNQSFTHAEVKLQNLDLPRQVEVRFSVSVSQPMMIALQLYDPRLKRSIVPLISGVPQPFGVRGAGTLLASQSDGLKFSLLGILRSFPLTVGQTYRCRLLREPERLWLYVDDQEVLTAEIPPLDVPELRFQGTFSEQILGAEITFDDVVIRAPAGAIRDRQLRSLVEAHFDRLGVRALVRDAIEKDPALAGQRDRAAKVLETIPENADWLLEASLATSAKKDAPGEERTRAILQAQRANQLFLGDEKRPEHLPPLAWRFLTAVGLAQVRAGQSRDAIASLENAVAVRRLQRGAADARQLAALALARAQADEADLAQSLRLQMHDLLVGASREERTEAQPWVAEVDARIEPAADEPQRNAIVRSVFATEEAGWKRRDLARYLAGRSADYREEAGRSATPDRFDVVLDRPGVEKRRTWEFRDPALQHNQLRHENVRLERDGDRATLRYQGTVQNGDWFGTWETTRRLVRTEGQWRIAFTRAWPIRRKDRARGARLDAAWYAARDTEADRATGPDRIRALLVALRPAEALALARKRTSEPKPTVADWLLHARAAVEASAIDEARQAYLRVEALDPEKVLPAAISGPVQELRDHAGEVYGVAHLPTGELLSGGSDGQLRRWDRTGKLLSKQSHPENRILSVAVSSSGKRVGTASTQVWLHEPDLPPRRLGGHSRQVYRIAFSADDTRVVSASADHTARIWQMTGGPSIELKGHLGDVLGAVFSPDGKWVATASHDGTARLWEAATGKAVRTFTGHSGPLKRVVFAPDGKTLATAGANGEARLWDVDTGKQRRSFQAGDELLDVLAFRPDGKLLAAGGRGQTIWLWRTDDGRLVRRMPVPATSVFALSFTADGKRLAAGAKDPVIRVWEVPEGK